jgi:hypothetical protein
VGALLELEKRLQNTNALIVQYHNALGSPDNEEYRESLTVSIRSLQKLHKRLEEEFLELAALEQQEIYRYRIIDTTERPTLGGIAEAWTKFQNLFSVVYSKLTKAPMPSPLGYGYCFEGSVGVVVTLPKLPAGMLAGDPIDDTSAIVFDMVESRRIPEIARELGPEPIAAMNEWLSVHTRHGYGIGLEWKSQRVTKRAIEVQAPELTTLQNVVAEVTTQVIMKIDGELVAVDVDEKTFRIKGDDGLQIEGGIGTAITHEHAASVPARYRATITKTTRMLPSKKEKPETFTLTELDKI